MKFELLEGIGSQVVLESKNIKTYGLRNGNSKSVVIILHGEEKVYVGESLEEVKKKFKDEGLEIPQSDNLK